MATETRLDALDEVVTEVRALYPELEVVGLPIVGRVLRLAQVLLALREEQLMMFGITVADFDVLASLRRRAGLGSVNVRDLQLAMMLSSSGITKRLDRLEGAEFVERQPDPADRRGVLIRLTSAGLELIDAAIPAITRFETQFVQEAIGAAKDREKVEAGLRQLLLAAEDDQRTTTIRKPPAQTDASA